MDADLAFMGYKEGPLLFRPTYRYDVGTDNYDTSEKMRIPAWTGKYLCLYFRRQYNDLLTPMDKTGFYTVVQPLNSLCTLGQS